MFRAESSRFCVSSRCPSILGEMFPARGLYYWETVVSGSAAYRLGVAYSTASSNGSLGENSSSWCLQCVPSSSGYAQDLFCTLKPESFRIVMFKSLLSCLSPAAGLCCSTIAFSHLCLWRIFFSEWEPSWTTSTAVCPSTTLKAAGCWVPWSSASLSPAARLWRWSSQAACSSAWCRSCPSLPRTASPATLLTLKENVYRGCLTVAALIAFFFLNEVTTVAEEMQKTQRDIFVNISFIGLHVL